MIIQDSRLQLKYSTISGVVPTIPLTYDHTDGTWLPTDIYIGEVFFNVTDNLAWWRSETGIVPFGATGGTSVFIGDFVSKTLGGTYSGPVSGPEFNANIIIGGTVQGVTGSFSGPVGASTFYGDGSNLTGIVATWNGGVVGNTATFQQDVTFEQNLTTDEITSISGTISVDGFITTNAGATFNGNVEAVSFIGDGSQLTGITGGINTYTTAANLIGNTIQFDRTDLANAYSVDLSSIVGAPVSSLSWNNITNEFELSLADGTTFTLTIEDFKDIAVQGAVTADYFVGDGSLLTNLPAVSGSTGATGPQGATGVQGATGPQGATGVATQSLSETLAIGNTSGGTDILITANDVIASESGTIKINPYYGGSDLFRLYTDTPLDFSYFQLSQGSITQRAQTDLGTGTGQSNFIITPSDGNLSVSDPLFNSEIYIANNNILSISNDTTTSDFTQISQSPTTILVENANTTTPGIQYDADYSANFNARTLVDKQYVDNAIVLPSLSQTLAIGNTSGGTNIVLSNDPSTSTSDSIIADGNTLSIAAFSFEDLGGSWAPIIKTSQGNATNYIRVEDSETFIRNSQLDAFVDQYCQIKNSPTLIKLEATNNINLNTSVIDITPAGNSFTINDGASINYSFFTQQPYQNLLGNVIPAIGATDGLESYLRNWSNPNQIGSSLRALNVTQNLSANIEAQYDGSHIQNILTASDGTDTSYIIQRHYETTVIGPATFRGIEYFTDYSANYSNRSLVDKEYVDNAISGGSLTLSQVLTNGNTSGTNNIIIDSGYGIKHDTDNTLMVEYGNDGTFDYISLSDTSSSTFKIRKDNDWRIDQTLGTVNTSVSSTLGDGTIDIFATDGTTSANISVLSTGEITMNGLLTNSLEYLNDNSSTFTNRSLVDKEYVDNIVGSFIPPISSMEIFRGRTFRFDSTTADTVGGIATLNNASAIAVAPNSTNFGNKFSRIRYYASIVSTGRVTSIRSTDLQWFIHGGFRFVSTWRVADTAYGSTCQNFHGLIATTGEIVVGGATLIQVSTLTNCIFVGNDGTDANLQVMHNDATGTCTKIDLGANFPANRTAGAVMTTMYAVEIYNGVRETSVKYRVTNLETGNVAEGTITTNLPATTQGLAIQSARVMGTPTTNTGQWEQHKWGCSDITA
jgi:hypothetical protein